jgi:hypothetical protein
LYLSASPGTKEKEKEKEKEEEKEKEKEKEKKIGNDLPSNMHKCSTKFVYITE